MSAHGRGAPGRRDPVLLMATCCGLGALVTLLAVVADPTRLAYRSIPAHIALETADAVIAALVAYLAYGRAQRTTAARDVTLAASIGLLALASVAFAATASVASDGVPGAYATWTVLATRLLAAGLLAGAGWLAPTTAAQRVRAPLATAATGLVATAVALAMARSHLPVPVDPSAAPADVTATGALAVLRSAQVAQAVLLAVGGAGYATRARRTRDPVEMWIGVGVILGAFAHLDYAILPSMVTAWVSAGDALRAAFYLLLLVSAATEITQYWAAQAQTAVFSERQRVARDLHDGAVQEIGYVRSVATRMARLRDDPDVGRIVAAAERALDEMRAALTALTAPLDEPLAETIRRTACEVADRYDVGVTVKADGEVAVTHVEREALTRIVREAATNAARHGTASKLVIDVRARPREVVVRDDGTGFDPDAARAGGFGIVSMRDRAAAIGGRLEIASAPPSGTSVRVTW